MSFDRRSRERRHDPVALLADLHRSGEVTRDQLLALSRFGYAPAAELAGVEPAKRHLALTERGDAILLRVLFPTQEGRIRLCVEVLRACLPGVEQSSGWIPESLRASLAEPVGRLLRSSDQANLLNLPAAAEICLAAIEAELRLSGIQLARHGGGRVTLAGYSARSPYAVSWRVTVQVLGVLSIADAWPAATEAWQHVRLNMFWSSAAQALLEASGSSSEPWVYGDEAALKAAGMTYESMAATVVSAFLTYKLEN